MHRWVLIALLLVPVAAHASRFEDLGPGLGLPRGSPSISSSKSLLAGVSAADLDGDGDLDLIVTEPLHGFNVYLREAAGFRAAPEWSDGYQGSAYGHTLFDMDGDGDLDLFFPTDDGDHLFANQDHKFVDVTAAQLPHLTGWSFTGTAVDLDGDGDLDLVVARYIDRLDFPSHRCETSLVLENDGSGRFRDVTPEAGLDRVRGCSFVSVAVDLDHDRDLDLINVNDFAQFAAPAEVWRNDGRSASGFPRFSEVAAELGFVAPAYGMGLAVEDMDQNGRLDFFVTNIGEQLFFELGADGRFAEVGAARGVSVRFAAERNCATWSARALDLDRDGYLDIIAAAGWLGAADFLGNGPDMQSLWLRGGPDGKLAAPPVSQGFVVPGSSMRDFALADIDGDDRPEIVAVHVHGGISVLHDREATPLPTTLELVPSTTGRGAAGAVVELSCDGVTRTRHVSGGGDYGSADLGEVSISFPAPCDTPGHLLGGTITWPSGYVQAYIIESGRRTRLAEDAWLTLTSDALTVDLSGHQGSVAAVTAQGFGLGLGTPELLGERRWSWPVALEVAEGAATIAIDGAPMGVLARVGRAPVEVWLDPPHPVAGRALTVYARFSHPVDEALVSLAGGPEAALVPFDDALMMGEVLPLAVGPSQLLFASELGDESVAITVGAPISEARSELVARDLTILASDASTKSARLRLYLQDDNGDRSAVPLEALALKVDGVLVDDVLRAFEADVPTLSLPHASLHDGAILQAVIDGVDRFLPQHVGQLESTLELGPLVAPERSWCALSEPRLRADGVDRGTVVLQLFDAQGARLLDLGAMPLVEVDGLGVLLADVRPAHGGWLMPIRAGAVPMIGRLSARLPGQSAAVECAIPLVTPPQLGPAMPDAVINVSPSVVRRDVPMTVRYAPLGADGRGLGSGVAFRFEVEGAEPELVTGESDATYAGLGNYELAVTPRFVGSLVVRIVTEETHVLSARTLEVFDPEGDPPPDVVEDGAEDALEGEIDAGDGHETDGTVGDAAEGGPPDATDVAVEPPEVGPEDSGEPDEPIDTSDGASPPETVETGEPGEPGETSEPLETLEPVAEAEAEEPETVTPIEVTDDRPDAADTRSSEPDPRPRGDDGCATGGVSLLALGALAVHARRRRESR